MRHAIRSLLLAVTVTVAIAACTPNATIARQITPRTLEPCPTDGSTFTMGDCLLGDDVHWDYPAPPADGTLAKITVIPYGDGSDSGPWVVPASFDPSTIGTR